MNDAWREWQRQMESIGRSMLQFHEVAGQAGAAMIPPMIAAQRAVEQYRMSVTPLMVVVAQALEDYRRMMGPVADSVARALEMYKASVLPLAHALEQYLNEQHSFEQADYDFPTEILDVVAEHIDPEDLIDNKPVSITIDLLRTEVVSLKEEIRQQATEGKKKAIRDRIFDITFGILLTIIPQILWGNDEVTVKKEQLRIEITEIIDNHQVELNKAVKKQQEEPRINNNSKEPDRSIDLPDSGS